MKKGQGSLEYLIIIAAVLAIAAIVVLFLTGAFSSSQTDVTECKQSAARCATELATSTGASCGYCVASCVDAANNSVGVSTDLTLYANTTVACQAGAANYIASA